MEKHLADRMREETERSIRIPGILHVDGAVGRRARIAGTGLDVWEIIQRYYDVAEDFEALARQFHWLTGDQLTAALDYYRAYPAEIDERLATEDGLVPAEVRSAASSRRAS